MRHLGITSCLLVGLAGLAAVAAQDDRRTDDLTARTDAPAQRIGAVHATDPPPMEAGGIGNGADDCTAAVPLPLPIVVTGTTIGATPDPVPPCAAVASAPGVWYEVTGTGTTITASLCSPATDYDTQLSVYCGVCDPEPYSDCCIANGSAGCSNPGCEAAVCAVDPFCCGTEWDDLCADTSFDLCGSLCGNTLTCVAGGNDSCGPQSQVSWCSQIGARYLVLVHGFAGATGNFELSLSENGIPCEATIQCLPAPCPGDTNGDKDVDVNDLNNIIVGWNTTGQLGIDPITGQPVSADVTDNFGGPPDGIVNVNDLNAVVVNWGPCLAPPNDECADKILLDLIPNAPAILSLDMRAATATTSGGCGDCDGFVGPPGGCSDPACEALVCAGDPFCCDTSWDSICAETALDLCDNCRLTPVCVAPAKDLWYCIAFDEFGDASPGMLTVTTSINLFAEIYAGCDCTGTPILKWCGPVMGGSDPIPVTDGDECCVRLLNAFDLPNGALLGTFSAFVRRPCGPGTGDCCVSNGSPGCEDPACCELVCSLDPFCCNITWDGTCGAEAVANCDVAVCGPCGNNASGDCCVNNASPGCDDLACCQVVCAADPFCCDTTWDQVCADAAVTACTGLCGP